MKKFTLALVIFCFTNNMYAGNGFLEGLKNLPAGNDKTLLIFYKPDCPYCINMDKAVSADLVFQKQLIGQYNIELLDITSAAGREIADKFNIHAVPSMVNYNNGTGESTIIKGFGSIEKLSAALGFAINNKATENLADNNMAACGDGIIDPGEQCDDGNAANGDGCSNVCQVEPGYNCVGQPSVCTAVCGDGIVAAGEQCDDGNAVNGDGCSNSCTIEPGYNCTGSPSVCVNYDDCSGAFTLPGSSGTVMGDNATATNSVGVPVPSCQSNINKDVWFKFTLAANKLCSIAVNGPGMADPVLVIYSGTCGALVQVACDDDSGPGNYSLIQTYLNAGTYYGRIASFGSSIAGSFSLLYNLNLSNICGNTILESGEECDDGNTTGGDGCSSTCKIENASSTTGVSINTDSTRANPSALLDVKSFDRGVLIPRMNSGQRSGIVSPAKGLLVFDITSNTFWFYNGTAWTEVGGTSGNTGSGLPAGSANQTLRNNGTNWVANSGLQNDGTNVTVTGQVKITGGAPALGKVLTSDATGLGSWQTPSNGSVAFSVRADSNRTLIHGASAIRLHFGNYGTNVGNFNTGAFNTTTDEFVAPSDGLYSFTFDLYLNPVAAEVNIITELRVDNSSNVIKIQKAFIDRLPAGSLVNSSSHTAILNLNTGDKVYLLSRKFSGGGTSNVTVDYGSNGIVSTFFMGYRIN